MSLWFVLSSFLLGVVGTAIAGAYLLVFLMSAPVPSAATARTAPPATASSGKSKETSGDESDAAWFGVVLQRWFDEQAASRVLTEHYQARLTHLFNKAVSRSAAFASRVESIVCQDLTLGSKCATLSRFAAGTRADGAARITFDMDYSGGAQFAIHLVLKLKLPFKKTPARIPAHLTVRIAALSGSMALVIPPGPHPLLQLAFVAEPKSEFDVSSEVGGSFRLTNLKRLHSFIISRLELQLRKDFVEPTGLCFNIPVKDEIKLQLRPLRTVLKAKEAEVAAAAAAAAAAAQSAIDAKKRPSHIEQSVPEDALAAELDAIGNDPAAELDAAAHAASTSSLASSAASATTAPAATASAASASASASATAPSGAAQFHGWLHKRGNLRHNWKRRYFLLYQDRAEYYSKELGATEAPPMKGSFLLAGCRVELTESSSKDKGKTVVISDGDRENVEVRDALFPFNVVSKDRTWRLKAESAELRDEWMGHFKALIDAVTAKSQAEAVAAKTKRLPPTPPPKKPQLAEHGAAASALVTGIAIAEAAVGDAAGAGGATGRGRARNLSESTPHWKSKTAEGGVAGPRMSIGTRGAGSGGATTAAAAVEERARNDEDSLSGGVLTEGEESDDDDDDEDDGDDDDGGDEPIVM